MTLIESLILLIFAWGFIGFICLIVFADLDLSILNPIRNYNKWDKMNWFGIAITTIILNIALLPYAIIYWMIYKLFTVGRKKTHILGDEINENRN